MLLAIGRIMRPHGVRGDVVVAVTTDSPHERFVSGRQLMTSRGDSLTVESCRHHSGRLIISFAGLTDRDAAAAWSSTELYVESDTLAVSDDPDSFSDYELVGLPVVTLSGDLIGKVSAVNHNSGQDLLVVERKPEPDALIPFVQALVPEVIRGERIVVDLPDGLLDLE